MDFDFFPKLEFVSTKLEFVLNISILPLALLIDFVFGDSFFTKGGGWFHITTLSGKFISFFERKIPRVNPSFEFISGIFLFISSVILFVFLPTFTLALLFFFDFEILVFLFSALLLKQTFALRSMVEHVKDVLKSENVQKMREKTSYLVSRDTSRLSEGHLLSAVLESIAENTTDAFISPLFWFSVGGLPFALLHRITNTLDSMVGYKERKYRYIGKFSAFFDEVLNLPPALISVPFVLLACKVCGSSTLQAFWTLKKFFLATGGFNSGVLIPLFAGACGVKLEKPGYYTVVGGKELPTTKEVELALKIFTTTCITFSVFASLVFAFLGSKVQGFLFELVLKVFQK